MNTFGKIFRISIWGESHGNAVGITIDGCPAGIAISEKDFLEDLERRKGGSALGTTPRKEDDNPKILSGVFKEHTTGAPITIVFENNNTRSSDYDAQRAIPRPGHADFVLNKKFQGFNDYRGGGHSSGRLTVALVAAGVIAKKIVSETKIRAQLIEAGGNPNIEAAIQKAIQQQDSIGGIVECSADGLPIGLGEPFFDSMESVISHLVFSVPAVKGIEFGSGFEAAKMTGSTNNDSIINESGTTSTNNSGGINGGITNGNQLLFRVVVKPTSSTPKEQTSFNLATGNIESFAVKGRHDLCIALRAVVVIEAVTAIAIADLSLQSRAQH